MANTTIGTSHSASMTKWLDEVYRSVLTTNMFAPLTGVGAGAVIRIDDTQRSEGDTYKYHFDDNIALSEWVDGDTQLAGNSKEYAIATDSLTLEKYRVARQLRSFSMSQLRTKPDLQARMKSMFASGMADKVQDLIIKGLIDTSSGRVQERYLYGAANSNWDATHTTALANVDGTNDKLTLAMISMARRKAVLQSKTVGKMMPATLKTQNGRDVKKYIMFAHEYAIRDLLSDATAVTALTQRNSEVFNVISGADFVGEYDGVLIYKTQLSDQLVTGAGASSIDVAHNLLLGAGAAVMSYGVTEMPEGTDNFVRTSDGKAVMTTEVSDHGANTEGGLTFIGGAKKLVDSSGTAAQDFGCVHVFSAGVAD